MDSLKWKDPFSLLGYNVGDVLWCPSKNIQSDKEESCGFAKSGHSLLALRLSRLPRGRTGDELTAVSIITYWFQLLLPNISSSKTEAQSKNDAFIIIFCPCYRLPPPLGVD